jgi:hypothetical protein
MGATVVMACRSPGRAKDARALLLQTRVTDVTGGVTGSVTGVTVAASKLVVLPLDLCDFQSVRAFVESFAALRLVGVGVELHKIRLFRLFIDSLPKSGLFTYTTIFSTLYCMVYLIRSVCLLPLSLSRCTGWSTTPG